MVGDSADPMIAAAAAFGADHFDRAAALAAMVRGATEPARAPTANTSSARASPPTSTRLRPLRRRHQRPQRQLDLRQPDRGLGLGGDDARVRDRRLRDRPVRGARAAATRRPTATSSHAPRNWRNLFDPASGLIEPRYASGAFPDPYDPLGGGGFVEGNAAQYTWMVPQDPAGLFRADGRAGQGRRAPRRLPARAQRRAREGPTPTTPCSATSRPWRRPGSTTGCAAPGRPRPRSAAALAPLQPDPGRLSRQRRPRDALGLVRLRRARPLPGAAGDRDAGARQPALRHAPKSRLAHGKRLMILARGAGDVRRA